MTRKDMLRLYGKVRRTNPCKAFEISIIKWAGLPDLFDRLMLNGETDPHWPSFDNCGLCHQVGYSAKSRSCTKLGCIIAKKGICGEYGDTYEQATKALRERSRNGFFMACIGMVIRLQREYLLYLLRDNDNSLFVKGVENAIKLKGKIKDKNKNKNKKV